MAPCHDNILLVVAWFRHIGSMGEKVGLKIISGFSFIILKKMLKNTNCNDGINDKILKNTNCNDGIVTKMEWRLKCWCILS